MAIILGKLDRNVIPRWRDFASTVQLGELNEPTIQRTVNQLDLSLDTLERDWQTNRSLSFAADLISAAYLHGATEIVREAALFVLELQDIKQQEHPLTRLARGILSNSKNLRHEAREVEIHSPEQMRTLISTHRRTLSSEPRDAILWVDLSLLHAMVGQSEKARRAMVVAVSLAPENRFVLRSAARLFIHLDEPDRAHRILKNSKSIRRDPWIISAEIATASAAKRAPFAIDQAIRTLAGSTFAPRETTELSAAVATLELRDGNARKAKKHIRNGLISPNENSLAQAKWISKELNDFLPEKSVSEFRVERSFEALAWEAFVKKDWTAAAANSLCWLKDQPFSAWPARVACQITSAILENFHAAENIAKFGLVANPNEHMLHIGLAYIYSCTERTDLASTELDQIHGSMDTNVEVALIANHGLIKFRQGDEAAGRALYLAAVEKARGFSDESLEAAALTYWAREEVRAKSAIASEVLGHAAEAVKKVDETVMHAAFILERVEREFQEMRKQTK